MTVIQVFGEAWPHVLYPLASQEEGDLLTFSEQGYGLLLRDAGI